jgi:hypothetical protein
MVEYECGIQQPGSKLSLDANVYEHDKVSGPVKQIIS